MAYQTAQEILEHITKVDPSRVQGINGVLFFDLSGEGGGQWTLTLKDEGVTLESGKTATPDATFSLAAQDFIAIANGILNPVSAFMQGKVRVTGDMGLAMRLQSLLF